MESATDDVGGRGSAAGFEFARLFTLEVVDLVTVAIDKDGTGGPHDGRTTIAAIILHPLAALSFPCNHLVFIFEAGHHVS